GGEGGGGGVALGGGGGDSQWLSLPAAGGGSPRRHRARAYLVRHWHEPLQQRPHQAAGLSLHRPRQLRAAAPRRRLLALAGELVLLGLRLRLAAIRRRLRSRPALAPDVSRPRRRVHAHAAPLALLCRRLPSALCAPL